MNDRLTEQRSRVAENRANKDNDVVALGRVFAEAIRFQRLVRRWTQADLSDQWQVSRALIAQMEQGGRKITILDVSQACTTFDVDLLDLLFMPHTDREDKERVWRLLTPLYRSGYLDERRSLYF